ncbi:MAG: EAL domain-containing protein [Azonexus sp.]|nr:EAL domain-containing protein [Azonexus sp.]
MSSISEELAEQIRAIREEVVMKTLSVTLLAGGVLLVGNMARNLHLGNSLSIIHPLLYLSLFSVFLLRRRIGAARIAWFTVILLYLAATVGLFIYGLAGNSAAVYMAFCFVSTTFFGVRGGVVAAVLSIGSFALVGILHVGGLIALSFDLPTYMQNPYSWLAAVLTIGSMSWLVLSQVGRLNERHMKLLCEQHHQARHDALTGLHNRVALESILEQSIADALREDLALAVILLDLDRFKNINDSLGHNAGDRLLVEVAARLQHCVRGSDTVARLSGDEFVILLPRLVSPDVTTIAGKLVEALSAPYRIGERELRTAPSVGISLCPRDAQDVETLIKYADTAMYAAKEKGGGRFQYFSPEMNQAATERLLIECRLREAIDHGRLALHYQPKIDMAGRLTGLEALLRMEIEGASPMRTAQYIAVAEESSLIDELGDWVIAAVCRQLRAWLDDGIRPPRVAINLSTRQLRQHDLAMRVARRLNEAAVAPDLLEFEVTETAAMENPATAARRLDELGAMGVTLSIDDFGTGYSSLSHLRSLPLDALKIDHSFVRDIASDASDLAIAGGTIALAHSLGLRVVAEGVETMAQWQLLRDHGCDEVQGYLIARPAPAEDLAGILSMGRIALPV